MAAYTRTPARILAELDPQTREKLRRAVLLGQDDVGTARQAKCAKEYAVAMRARLSEMGLVPGTPSSRASQPADPRQLGIF